MKLTVQLLFFLMLLLFGSFINAQTVSEFKSDLALKAWAMNPSTGNLYLVALNPEARHRRQSRLLQISPDGTQKMLATNIRDAYESMRIDAKGNLYIAVLKGIVKVTPAGKKSRIRTVVTPVFLGADSQGRLYFNGRPDNLRHEVYRLNKRDKAEHFRTFPDLDRARLIIRDELKKLDANLANDLRHDITDSRGNIYRQQQEQFMQITPDSAYNAFPFYGQPMFCDAADNLYLYNPGKQIVYRLALNGVPDTAAAMQRYQKIIGAATDPADSSRMALLDSAINILSPNVPAALFVERAKLKQRQLPAVDKGGAHSAQHQEMLQQITRDLSRALFLQPRDWEIYQMRIALRRQYNFNPREILGDLNSLVTGHPDKNHFYLQRAEYLRTSGDPAAAIGDLDSILDRMPENAEAYYQRALAHMGMANFRIAINDLDMAVKYQNTLVDAHIHRALAYYRLGDSQRALDNLASVRQYYPENQKGHYFWGRIRLEAAPKDPAGCDAIKKAVDLGMDPAYYFLMRHCRFPAKTVACFNCHGKGEVDNYRSRHLKSINSHSNVFVEVCRICNGIGQLDSVAEGLRHDIFLSDIFFTQD